MTLEIRVDDEIILREFAVSDSKVIYNLIDNNREYISHLNGNAAAKYPNEQAVVESIEDPSNHKIRMGIWYEGEYAGTINLTPESTSIVLGYYLGEEFAGGGIMTKATKAMCDYACGELGELVVSADVHPKNKASQAVLKRSGFNYSHTNEDNELVFHYSCSGES